MNINKLINRVIHTFFHTINICDYYKDTRHRHSHSYRYRYRHGHRHGHRYRYRHRYRR